MEQIEKPKRRPRGLSARGTFDASKQAALSLIEQARAEQVRKTNLLRAMRLSMSQEDRRADPS